jgi:hypothetical protein
VLFKAYEVKKIQEGILTITGKGTCPVWNIASSLSDFIFAGKKELPPQTQFKALWDKEKFYFRFVVTCKNVYVFVDKNTKMEVLPSDRVELFFRIDEHLNPYFCIEIDSLGRVLDYRARYYRLFEYEWQWPGCNELEVKASYTHEGYIVEGALGLKSLKELGLIQNNCLHAGLFRGERLSSAENNTFRWISWVAPYSDKPDFHIPSVFGILKLSEG